jgi:hypothetical protein
VPTILKTGTVIWEERFDEAGEEDGIRAIAVQGNLVFTAGFGVNSAGNGDFLVRVHNAKTGALQWEDQADQAGGSHWASDIAVKGNRVFAVGTGTNAAGNWDFWVRAYDAR